MHFGKLTIAVCLVVPVLFAKNCFSEDKAAVDFRTVIGATLARLAAVTNASIETTNTLWWSDGPRSSSFDTSTVRYLTSVAKYRTIYLWVSGDPPANPELQSSYDGDRYADFAGGELRQIQYSKTDNKRSLEPINPLLAPLIFLSRDGDTCPLWVLRMKDVADGEASNFLGAATLTSGTAGNANGSPATTFSLAGDPMNGQPTSWRVTCDLSGSNPRITSAVKTMNSGKVNAEYTFESYRMLAGPGGPLWYPAAYTIQLRESGVLTLTELVSVVSATLDPVIPTNSFDIVKDLNSRAVRIYSVDGREYDRIPRAHDPQALAYVKRRPLILGLLAFMALTMLLWLVKGNKAKG